MRFILDGHNVLNKISRLVTKKQEYGEPAAREALINYVVNWKTGRNPNDEIYIIFDSRIGGDKVVVCGIKCNYAKDADKYIISMMRNNDEKNKTTIVISDDNQIKNACREYRVEVRHPSYLEKDQPRQCFKQKDRKIENTAIRKIKKKSYLEKLKDRAEQAYPEYLWILNLQDNDLIDGNNLCKMSDNRDEILRFFKEENIEDEEILKYILSKIEDCLINNKLLNTKEKTFKSSTIKIKERYGTIEINF